MNKGKVLVTGSAGFIGSAVAERMASAGYEVTGIDNLNSYYTPQLKIVRLKRGGFPFDKLDEIKEKKEYPSAKKNLAFIRGDISDLSFMEKLFENKKFDIVINLAAQAGVRYSIENPFSYLHSNIEGFLVLLECARHHKPSHFIYASSSSVYGGNKKTPFSESDNVDHPVSLYAASKKSNELMAEVYSHLYDFPTTGLRFFTVYGPYGRPDMAPMLFAEAISGDKPIKVFNNGDMLRDFTYIDDIVEGVIKVAEKEPEKSDSSKVYNIGCGHPESLLEFISLIEKELGKKAIKEMLPMQPGDVPVTYADTTLLEHDYGYSPTTTLSEGIHKFIVWFKKYKDTFHKNL